MKLETINALIEAGKYIGVVFVSLYGFYKGYIAYLVDAQERYTKKLEADVEKAKAQAQVEIERLKTEVALAKENSAGAEAIKRLQQIQADFERRINELEAEVDRRTKIATDERQRIMRELEQVKREQMEVINESLRYFMGRK